MAWAILTAMGKPTCRSSGPERIQPTRARSCASSLLPKFLQELRRSSGVPCLAKPIASNTRTICGPTFGPPWQGWSRPVQPPAPKKIPRPLRSDSTELSRSNKFGVAAPLLHLLGNFLAKRLEVGGFGQFVHSGIADLIDGTGARPRGDDRIERFLDQFAGATAEQFLFQDIESDFFFHGRDLLQFQFL